MLFSKSKGLVGLDIGSSAVKLVELKKLKGDNNWKLVNLGIAPLSPEVIVDGSIMDGTVVVDAINQLFTENKIKTNDVALSVSGHSVIIKKITMAYMSDEELAESIRWEAESYIPFDIDDVHLDYQVLDEEDRGDGNMDVLLVAAKKEKVSEYLSVVQQAGKNPVMVDVDSFALQNALTGNYELSQFQVTALINIGASVMNINIMQGDNTIFWRDISFGGNMYTDAIQKDLGVDFETAEALKMGESVDGISFSQVTPILKNVTNDLGVEIQKTFDFFKATTSAEKINRIMLSGGCADILELDTYLADRFEATVDFLNPFQNISYNEKQFNPQVLHELRASSAIAAGLAMKGSPSKSMLRINLVSEKKTAAPKPVKREAREASELQENLILIMFLGLAALVFFVMRHFVKQELNEKRREEASLSQDYKQNWQQWQDKKVDYEIQKELLNEKIQKISELRDKRQGPVKLMEDVINTMPESVWLESITQGYNKALTLGKGNERKADTPSKNLANPNMVRVTGFAKTTDAVTNFADRLYRLDERYSQVDLSVIRRLEEQDTSGKQFRFEIFFEVLLPSKGAEEQGSGS